MKPLVSRATSGVLATMLLLSLSAPARADAYIERASVSGNDNQYSLWSNDPSISSNGNRVAFLKSDSNDGSVNNIYVRTRSEHETTLISGSQDEDGSSEMARISGNGNYVVFESTSDDLVSGDNNGEMDIFRTNLSNGTTQLVSANTDGDPGNGWSENPSISNDGRYVAFQSGATNLVASDVNNYQYDVFVKDMQSGSTGTVTLGNVTSDGDRPPCDDYGYYDLPCGAENPQISGNGEFIAFDALGNYTTDDDNALTDVFRHNLDSGGTIRISQASNEDVPGGSIYPAISSNGSIVAFVSQSTTLVPGDNNATEDAFVYDVADDSTVRVSTPGGSGEADGTSDAVSVSADGSLVGFESEADNLVGDDNNGWRDGFVYDRATGDVRRVTKAGDGTEGDDESSVPRFAGDDLVTFSSWATNFVSGDTNDSSDVFVRSI